MLVQDLLARVERFFLDLAPALRVPEALLGYALGDGDGHQGRKEHQEEDELAHIFQAS
jgi:hypothetical protein